MTWDAFFISFMNDDYKGVQGNLISGLKKVDVLGEVAELILVLKTMRDSTMKEYFTRRILKEDINVEETEIYDLFDAMSFPLCDDLLIQKEIDIETHADVRFLTEVYVHSIGNKYFKFLYQKRYGTLEGYDISWRPDKVKKIVEAEIKKREEARKKSK